MTVTECEDIVRELDKVTKARGTLMDRAQEAIEYLLEELWRAENGFEGIFRDDE